MSKYIIDIPKTVGMTEKVGSVHYTYFDGIQCQTIIMKSDDIEELNSDYINEHFSDLQDTAYQRGLDDAWETARKIVCDESFDWNTLLHIFDSRSFEIIFGNFSASEAVAKIKAYEEKQNDKIEVGDEVTPKRNVGWKGVVVGIDDDNAMVMTSDGYSAMYQIEILCKTGRHFDIASILEDMRND